jgi:hypothetical protein
MAFSSCLPSSWCMRLDPQSRRSPSGRRPRCARRLIPQSSRITDPRAWRGIEWEVLAGTLPQTDRPRRPSPSRMRHHDQRWPRIAALDRPAFVPRTTGRRQEMTGRAGASDPQVRNQGRPPPQVAGSAPRTLSRWRHGFKSRWAASVKCQVRALIVNRPVG